MSAPSNRPRQPKGIPTGGEYAPLTGSKPAGALGVVAAHQVHAREMQLVAGSSDKFYRVFVDGCTVTAQYGRNGTPGAWTAAKDYADPEAAEKAADKIVAGKLAKGYGMTGSGTLTFDAAPAQNDMDRAARSLPAGEESMPVGREQSAVVLAANARTDIDHGAAARVHDALTAAGLEFNGDLADGVYPHPPTVPMLAKIVDPPDLERLLASDSWVTQPKLDGDRVAIVVDAGVVSVLNRQGQPKARNVSDDMIAPFRGLTQGRWVLDGEVVGRTLHLFDMPAAGGFHDENATFTQRDAALRVVLDTLNVDPATIRPVATAAGEHAKRAMMNDARTQRREGIILRNVHAGYDNGRRSENLLKKKLHREVDAYITAVGVGGKDNAVLAVRDRNGKEQIIGQVSTIGKGPIAVGDVVEARFLNVANADSPTLFQPRIMRTRTDKSAAECSIEQLAGAEMDKDYTN